MTMPELERLIEHLPDNVRGMQHGQRFHVMRDRPSLRFNPRSHYDEAVMMEPMEVVDFYIETVVVDGGTRAKGFFYKGILVKVVL